MVFPVLVGVVGIAAATVCVVSLDDDSLTVKLKTTDKTRIFYLTKKTLSKSSSLGKNSSFFFVFVFFRFFRFHFHTTITIKKLPHFTLSSSSSSKFFPLFSFYFAPLY